MKFLSPLPALLAALLLASCQPDTDQPGDVDPELSRLEARAQGVTIIRDDFGVPHIYGTTDADAVFGMLYAQSEDDFKRVEQNYIWAIGRLAEVEGEGAIYSDLRARLYMTIDEAKLAYQSSPAWLQALCDAFADGVNYYLATHPEVTPRLLTRFEPWMPMFFSEGSIGGDIEQIPLDGIAAFYGGANPVNLIEGIEETTGIKPISSAPTTTREFAEPRGSNGFAISGELTASGNAMLLINPHTSFFFRGESQVVSEEGLNAYGASTWGQFFIYQGFNEHTGWMHTSTHADFMDEFVEDVFRSSLEDGGRLLYRYGEENLPVEVSEVTLRYTDGERLNERTFTLYHTHHGPITHSRNGKWVATRINWDPVHALEQSFIRTKLSSHDEFLQMMNIRTNSSNNTVFADSQGNIAYYHGNFMPRRDEQFDYSKPVDGSDPATDWQGLHSVDETVTVFNPPNGWLQNCNSTPFTAAGQHSPNPDDYPAYMAPDAENFRAVHAVRVLTDQSNLTLDGLIELAYDPYLPGFEVLLAGLIEAYEESATPPAEIATEISAAIEALKQWDLQVSADSIAMTLAHFYGSNTLADGQVPEAMQDASDMTLINYFGSESDPAERRRIFADTIAMLKADYGRWDIPWGEVNRYQRINGDIQQPFDDGAPSLPVGMASGRWGALASFGARRTSNTKRLYGTSGNSFVAVVEFGDKVQAKSLLAGGQSGDVESPHFADQAQRYADGKFKDIAFYREDVEARAARTYHPGG